MHVIDLQWFNPMIDGMLYGLLAMVLHEFGHLCVAQGLGLKVKHVGLCWKGMYTVREAGSPRVNLRVSLAGPLTNLALIALWPVAPTLGLANLVIGVTNLLPIPGSDGERALSCLRAMREAKVDARRHKNLSEIVRRPFGAVPLDPRKKSVDPAA